jgi:tetratricopeptide (TPR) repeat protein
MPGRFRFRGTMLGVLACASFTAEARAAEGSSQSAPNPLPAPNAPAANDRVAQRARELFDEGVRLANEQRFESARAVFRSAYELQPHPSVLYNIAQCEVRLGDTSSAIATLERFLETGGREIRAEQRLAVQKQLDELRASLPAEQPASETPPTAPGDQVLEQPGNTPMAGELVPAAPRPANTQRLRAEGIGTGSVDEATDASGAARSLRPLVLAGTGVALLGAATALYLWNDARHEDWSTERAELAATPGFRDQLARDPALWQRARASNQQLSSIHTVDAVTVLLAGAGALAVGAGIWDWLASDGSAREATSAPLGLQVGSSAMLRWQGRW